MKKALLTGLKGFGMGAANVVPGVSGGTVALLTGIYGEIVAALDSLTQGRTWKALFQGRWKDFWQAVRGSFLLPLGVGVVLSVLSLAKLMVWLMGAYPVQVWAFFFGLILASAFVLLRDISSWRGRDVLLALLGLGLGVWVCTLDALSGTPDAPWYIFLCGAVSVCTMILPGVSGSFVLLVLDKYEYVMKAIDPAHFNLPVVVVFALGCVVGLLAFAIFLHWLLGQWEKQTMIVLLGFILGSLVKVWPWSNPEALVEAGVITDPSQAAALPLWPSALLWSLAGLALVVALEFSTPKKQSNQ